MKNNQRNRSLKILPLDRAVTELVKDMQLIGADIKITDSREITIPRAEYTAMVHRMAYLDVIRDLLRKNKPTDSDYVDAAPLRKLLGILDPVTDEKEDF